MSICCILDHPYTLTAAANTPHQRAYTAAVAKAVSAQADCDLIDLQALGYDPVMRAADLRNWRTQPAVDDANLALLRRLQAADTLVFVFPVWWELMPATTLGFLDKVLAKGQVGKHRRLFDPHTKVRVLATMGTPSWYYRWHYGDPIKKVLGKGTFHKLGVKDVRCHYFNAEDRSAKQRADWLAAVPNLIR